jgi:hypothetical protein
MFCWPGAKELGPDFPKLGAEASNNADDHHLSLSFLHRLDSSQSVKISPLAATESQICDTFLTNVSDKFRSAKRSLFQFRSLSMRGGRGGHEERAASAWLNMDSSSFFISRYSHTLTYTWSDCFRSAPHTRITFLNSCASWKLSSVD